MKNNNKDQDILKFLIKMLFMSLEIAILNPTIMIRENRLIKIKRCI